MGRRHSVQARRARVAPGGRTIVHGDTHHERLQVAPNACVEVVRAAARALLKQCHPDKNPDRLEWADAQTRMITESMGALTDPDYRRLLDTPDPEVDTRADTQADIEMDPDVLAGHTPRPPEASLEERRFQQGYVAHLHGRYREAIQAYEHCLITNPKNAAAHYNIGCIYEAQGFDQKAGRAYHAAHVVEPGYRDAATRSAQLTRPRFSASASRSPLWAAHA